MIKHGDSSIAIIYGLWHNISTKRQSEQELNTIKTTTLKCFGAGDHLKKEIVDSNLKIAEIHVKRLKFAMQKLTPIIPLTGKHFSELNDEEISIFELFSSRFAKLHDLMGAKLFGQVLELAEEPGSLDTFLDKLHRLEKIGIVDAQQWLLLREIKNQMSHEYPDAPEINANYFNQAYQMAHSLLEILENIKNFVKRLQ